MSWFSKYPDGMRECPRCHGQGEYIPYKKHRFITCDKCGGFGRIPVDESDD